MGSTMDSEALRAGDESESVREDRMQEPPNQNGLNVREQRIHDDYDWCLRDPEVQRKYAGKVVAVHCRKVWGSGRTHAEATNAALKQTGCPPREDLAKVFIEGQPLSPVAH
jgi:hypothetical protein